MAQQKKIPLRMCSGCMERKPKKEMIRIVRTPQGEIKVDFTSKCSGRGVYICQNAECLKKAIKAKRFERALDCQIPPEVYERLETEMAHGAE